MSGKEVEKGKIEEFKYEDFINLKYKLLLNTDYYDKESGIWIDKSANFEYMKNKIKDAEEITVVGIIKPKKESNITEKEEWGLIYKLFRSSSSSHSSSSKESYNTPL